MKCKKVNLFASSVTQDVPQFQKSALYSVTKTNHLPLSHVEVTTLASGLAETCFPETGNETRTCSGKTGLFKTSSSSYPNYGGNFSDRIAKGFLDGVFILHVESTMTVKEMNIPVVPMNWIVLFILWLPWTSPVLYHFLSPTSARPFLSPLPLFQYNHAANYCHQVAKNKSHDKCLNEMTSLQRHVFISSGGNSITLSLINYPKGNIALCR